MGALLTTMTACTLTIVQIRQDVTTNGTVMCTLDNQTIVELDFDTGFA